MTPMKTPSRHALAAQSLRADLKAAKIPAKAVSVRAEPGSLRVSIKSADVSVTQVTALAEKYEKIHRDQFGGILSGGNFFVFVDLERSAIDPLVREVLQEYPNSKTTGFFVKGVEAFPVYDGGDFSHYGILGHNGPSYDTETIEGAIHRVLMRS